MVFDIVEECFYLQMVDDSKTKKTEALIDETAAFQDEVLGKSQNLRPKKNSLSSRRMLVKKGSILWSS